MKKLLFIPLLFISLCLSAAPIGEKKAREIATQFFSQTVTRGASVNLDLEWAGSDINAAVTRGTVTDADEALMYIYNRADAKGFVIVSGDNSTRPIIAYSNEGNFEVNNIADATRWMLSAWCDQIEASREANIPPLNGGIIFDDTDDNVEELLYETAKWNQGEPYNRLSPQYTGGKAPSGCVATAICIVMRYHCWPDCGVGTTPSYTLHPEGQEEKVIPANELGREYKWNNMLMEYHRGEYTTYEGDAVAQLMYDVGTAMSMGWAPGGSGAVTAWMPERMSKYFKYSKGSRWLGSGSYTEQEWYDLLKKNLVEYGPMVGAGGGHAYVLDGYDKRDYFHLNYGWGGSADGYYYLPDNDFCRSMGAAFYFEPDRDGTSQPRDVCSYVALGTNRKNPENPEENVWTCTWWGLESKLTEFQPNTPIPLRRTTGRNGTLGPFTGYVNLMLCDRDGNFIETVEENYYDNLPQGGELWKNSDGDKKVIIKSDLKPGYRLRYYYKGQNPGEWEWMRDGSEVFEIVVCASPEEIAENLKMTYDKADKVLSFYSTIALKYEVKDSEGNVKTSGATAGGVYFNRELDSEYSIYHERGPKVDMSKFEPGEYTVSFTCGSDPYVLKVQL